MAFGDGFDHALDLVPRADLHVEFSANRVPARSISRTYPALGKQPVIATFRPSLAPPAALALALYTNRYSTASPCRASAYFINRRRTRSAPFGLAARSRSRQLRDWRRAKIWEFSPNLHCSIVGTFPYRVGIASNLGAPASADAERRERPPLARAGVRPASRRDRGRQADPEGVDRRHEAAIRRFGRVERAPICAISGAERSTPAKSRVLLGC